MKADILRILALREVRRGLPCANCPDQAPHSNGLGCKRLAECLKHQEELRRAVEQKK